MNVLRQKRAFTVVELLVVIAIIGVLVALLLPAVQMAREAARRTTCQSHMTECGTAFAGYATAKGFLPASRTWNPNVGPASNPGKTLNWPYPILPQLEQTVIHRDIMMNGALPTIETSLPILLCPSQTNFDPPVMAGVAPGFPLSYIVNGGRSNANLAAAGTTPQNHDWEANGAFVDKGIDRTPKYPNYRIDEIAAADGTSTTLLMSETVNAQSWLEAPLEQHSQMLWFAKNPQAPGFIGLNQNRREIGSPPAPVTAATVDGLNLFARPSSDHPNGFNVLMADGSVRYVQDTVEYRIYAVLMTSNGAKAASPSATLASQTLPNPVWQHPPGAAAPDNYPGTELD